MGDIEVESSCAALLPIALELSVEMAAPEGHDGVCPSDGPEHAGLLEAGADYGPASGFDDARADKQVLAAKPGVVHALGISLKVICLDANLFDDFRMGGIDGAQREGQFFDLPFI